MNHQNIIEIVDKSIDVLCEKFRSYPTLFFTENDIVCYFYTILQPKLKIFNDKDGYKHSLIHTEYPTPFRCDMSNNQFVIKKDNARTEKGRKYRRGHYDILILNPDFIKEHSYKVIKAQDYDLYKREVKSYDPIPVLYGIEFMFRRKPLKFSRGKDKEKGLDNFIEKVIQDADKLLKSKEMGFMEQSEMLVFAKGSSKEIRSLMRKKLSNRNEIILCFDD